ncbi:D-alanyl-D-alanine carboxypeptidase family protein [Acetonema longum]|uniref:serine-type D-Ala-D-Ala carboxypeptidase n=1 Tax=Acetonema longum DSM 6540 TaxID=1009370 RepID=F7NJ20_9FIRM|nr:D-alanyl-D-alanine carboxypeptidase family protein [Acetonema longum]EGO64017.1 Serine-type D-Ala-D-Ala carboxypeptidase [Acetonema longum DSM 6540]
MKIRRQSLILSVLSLYCLWLIPPAAAQSSPPPGPVIAADAAVLMDAKTGEVLWGKKAHERRAPASTTKILTAIVALERGQLDADVLVSPKAAHTPGSSMKVYSGQSLSLREMLTGLLLSSGNDAAVAIAEHIAGSVEEFAPLLNSKAAELGAKNTHFINPHGLTVPGHYSSAYDLALLTRYALANPIFAEIVRTKEESVDWQDIKGKEQAKTLRNTNRLLWLFPDADGVKTGTTGPAGKCLVSSASRGNQKLIAVVLHDNNRWTDSIKILEYGFRHFNLAEYAPKGQVIASLPVENGLYPAVNAIAAENAALVVKADDLPNIRVTVNLPEKIKAPVFPGQKLGEIVFYSGDQALKRVDVIAEAEVTERSYQRMLLNALFRVYRTLSGWGLF